MQVSRETGTRLSAIAGELIAELEAAPCSAVRPPEPLHPRSGSGRAQAAGALGDRNSLNHSPLRLTVRRWVS